MRDERIGEFVSEVRSRSDILQVIESYVPLRRKGGRYWGCCPFHHEKTPSFSVVPEKGFFYCFGCHAGGDAIKFISLIEGVSYFEAVKLQAEKLNIALPKRQLTPEEEAREREREALFKVLALARDFYHNCLTMTRYGEEGMAYLTGRGFSRETIDAFSLGFAPRAFEKLTQAFLKRGVKADLLLKSGLSLESRRDDSLYDRFRGRVIIPIADERGRVVGFGGRVLDGSQPKYLNTPETMIFNKRRLLFGLDRAKLHIKEAGFAIVVEGYMDAISVFGAGVQNVVASLGTAFTSEHAKKLMRYAKDIYFCYDSDEAGQQATMRALSLAARETGASFRVITVPDGKDPDEFIKKHGSEAFQALIREAKPLSDFQMDYVLKHVRYDTLEGKGRALRELLPVLSSLSGLVRGEYVKRAAQALMVDEGLVRSELAAYRGEPVDTRREERAPIRKVVHETDDKLRKAGRILIREAFADEGVLAEILAALPLEGIADEPQREIFAALKEHGAEALGADDLSEAAGEELSRALVEQAGEGSEASYQDSLKELRRAYLSAIFMEHSARAGELEKAGDYEGCLNEMNEVQRIKNEIAAL